MAPALTSVFMNDHDMLPSLFNDDDILSIFPRCKLHQAILLALLAFLKALQSNSIAA